MYLEMKNLKCLPDLDSQKSYDYWILKEKKNNKGEERVPHQEQTKSFEIVAGRDISWGIKSWNLFFKNMHIKGNAEAFSDHITLK